MRGKFHLFQSHLDLAHDYWNRLLQPGDRVIDATGGNGYDSLYLAGRCLSQASGELYVMDVQEEAIEESRRRLQGELEGALFERVVFLQQCHSTFPATLSEQSVKLIVYNLGYLPGGHKEKTTQVSTTLESLKKALDLVMRGGAISITCYPGHEEGAREEEQLLLFCQTLDPKVWSCCHHRWINRMCSPSLLLVQSCL